MSAKSHLQQHQQTVIIVVVALVALVVLAVAFFKQHPLFEPSPYAPPARADLKSSVGDDSAKASMIVYTDPLCDKCSQYHRQVLEPLYDTYVKEGKLKIEIRPLGIVSEYSQPLVTLLMCANEQQRFWPTLGYVYEQVEPKNGKTIIQNATSFFSDHPSATLATVLALNQPKLDSCIKADTYKTKSQAADQQAYNGGVYSAPTTYIDGSEPIRGVSKLQYVKSIIDLKLDS